VARRSRWDSLAFQFPNQSLSLSWLAYDGPDPDGFAHYSEVLARIERYAALHSAPAREHLEVHSVGWLGRCDWVCGRCMIFQRRLRGA
jgi:hypothetical protein